MVYMPRIQFEIAHVNLSKESFNQKPKKTYADRISDGKSAPVDLR